MIPTISSARLTLRPFRTTDVLALHTILSAPDVLMFRPDPTPPPLARIEPMIDRFLAHWAARGFGIWALTKRDTGDFMGYCGLRVLDETGEVEVDYLMGPDYWGLGYATEAAEMAIAFGFARPEIDRIIGLAHPDNIASCKVMEKNGMSGPQKARYFGGDCLKYEIRRTTA